MPVDPDKLAASLGAIDPDSLAKELGGSPAVTVKGHTRAKPGLRPRGRFADVPLVLPTPMGPVPAERGPVAESLSPIGAALGGLAGTRFGLPVPGAAIGGSLGEAGSQMLMGEPLDPMRISQAGPTQAAYEAVGGLAGSGLKKVSGPIMQLALRVGDPQIAATAIREGISATKVGMRKLLTKLGTYGAETERLTRQASRLGKPYDMTRILKDAYQDVYPKVEVSMTGDELRSLQESISRFVGQNPKASQNAYELHRLKKAADTAAAKIYDLPLGQRPSPAQEAAAGFYKSFADRARQTLNATIQGYEASNAPTEALIKLKDVLSPTAKKEMSKGAQVASAVLKPGVRAAIGASVGYELPGDKNRNALTGAALGAFGASPQALSGVSLALQNPMLQMILRQFPRAVGSLGY